MGRAEPHPPAPPGLLDDLALRTQALVLAFDCASLELVNANPPARCLLCAEQPRAGASWLAALLASAPKGISLDNLRQLPFGRVKRGRLAIPLQGRMQVMRLEAYLADPQRPVLIIELTEVIEDEEAITGVEASAKRFKALLEGLADAYYDWHILTDFVDLTAPLDAMLGLEPGGVPRTNIGFRDRIHPEDRHFVIAANTRAVAEGAPYVGEYRMRREDGSYILVRDRGIVIRDENGRPTHQVGTIRDITLERQTEQALRDSRELYRTLFTTATNPAYRVDAASTLVDANPAGLELLETQGDMAIGSSLESIFPREFARAVQQALSTGAVLWREAELHTDDRPRHLLFTIVPCDVGGDSSAFLLGTDVTPLFRDLRGALTESENALRHQAELLEERNAAMAATLEQMHRDNRDLEQNVMSNLEQYVLPTLERTRRSLGLRPEAAQLDALAHSLREIGRPLLGLSASSQPIRAQRASFTRRETEILHLIRSGRTTAEIAESLYLSPATVTYHRRKIRRKLGLQKGDSRLDTYFFGSQALVETPPS